MTTTINVPHNYMRCLHATCPKREDCMRRLAAEGTDGSKISFFCFNPNAESAGTERCTAFAPIRKVRYAVGLKHLFDNVPGRNIKTLRNRFIAHFGRSMFYDLMVKGKRRVTPKEQEYIESQFRAEGIDVPAVYDAFEEDYDWYGE